jgi:hypothetical protein
MLNGSVAFRNGQAQILADTFAGGVLELRSGSQPASADAAPTGTLLMTINLPDPALVVATDGLLIKDGDWSGSAITSGVVGWARFRTTGDAEDENQTDERLDCDVTDLIGLGIIKLISTQINQGQVVRFGNVILKFPSIPGGQLSRNADADLQLPEIGLLVDGGVLAVGVAANSLPMLGVVASSNITVGGSGATIDLPFFELSSGGGVELKGQSENEIPFLQLTANSNIETGAIAIMDFPFLTLQSNSLTNVTGVAALSMPFFEVAAATVTPRFAAASLVIPPLSLVANQGSVGPPDPNPTWPNEPSGVTVTVSMSNFTSNILPTQLAGPWEYSANYSINVEVVNGRLRWNYRKGFRGGASPGRAVINQVNQYNFQNYYYAVRVRYNMGWQRHPTADKIAYCGEMTLRDGNPGVQAGQFYFAGVESRYTGCTIQASQGGPEVCPIPFDSVRNFPCGPNEPRLALNRIDDGFEHLIEHVLIGSTDGLANGQIHSYVDGILQWRSLNVKWTPLANTRLYGCNLDPVWGGGEEPEKQQDDWMEFSQVRVSGWN